MSGEADGNKAMDSFQEWQLGVFFLFVMIIVVAIFATLLQSLSVPFGTEIGVLGGSILTFLAFSYWYYGR